MQSLELYAENIEQKGNIWVAKNSRTISFPDDGYANCMQIEENSFWFKHRNNCIASLVKSFSAQDTFFDIGGGNGYVSVGLEKAGIETVLVEPGEVGAMNAQKRGLKNVVCATLEDAHFKANSLPSVGVFDVVEHIEKDLDFVKMLHNYLVPHGKLYATVPSFNWLWSGEDVSAGHYRRYTITNFNNLLEQAGFKILYSTYIFSVLPLPIFLLRSLPSKFGLDKNRDLSTNTQEHNAGQEGIGAKIMNKIWAWELANVNKCEHIGFGGSCLVVAKKI
jgi:2-polyprenyl-3-methyl-5-hydroxy-6-metoxy-1,4-benzoquinol methylase